MLQNQLLDKTGAYPPPRSPLQLRDPRAPPPDQLLPVPDHVAAQGHAQAQEDMGASAASQLQAAAAAAAQAENYEHLDAEAAKQREGEMSRGAGEYSAQQTQQQERAPSAKMVSSKG